MGGPMARPDAGGMQAAAGNFPMEEEKRAESDIDMSAFQANNCVYCMSELTDSD